MERIVFATGNMDKLREIKMIMEGLPYEVVSMKEVGIDPDIDENADTYEGNALIKAKAVAAYCDDIVMADDSGFEVDALDKQPGVYSSRFLGTDTPYDVKINYLLEKTKGVPMEKRGARFVAAIACVFPDGRETVIRQTMEGLLAEKPAGKNGFGYDPILFLPEYGCTSAELEPEEKNRISHRGKALEEARKLLEEML